MMSLFNVESETVSNLISKALGSSSFSFEVTDTREMLLWKYLAIISKQLSTDEQKLIDDPVFEVLYLTSRVDLEEILNEKGIYMDENVSRVLLVVIINYINNDCEASLDYFASNAPPDAMASLLSWEGMIYELVQDLFTKYQGERTEELILILEAYGFEGVLDQVVPTDVLEKVFDLCLLPEKAALRSTCHVLANRKSQLDPIFNGTGHFSLFSPDLSPNILRVLAIDSQFLRMLQYSEESHGYLQNKIPTLARFPALVKQLIVDDHPKAERMLLLFVKYYTMQHACTTENDGRPVRTNYKEKEWRFISWKLHDLKNVLSRADGLKSTPTLLRCIAYVDGILTARI